MDVSKETKTDSHATRGGKIVVGALVMLIGGVWLAFGLTTWGEKPLRGLGFTVLALGAAVVAGLLWGRAPEPMAGRLRPLAYGLLCAAVVLIAASYISWIIVAAIALVAAVAVVTILAVRRNIRLRAAEEQRRRAADWEAYERGYPDRSKWPLASGPKRAPGNTSVEHGENTQHVQPKFRSRSPRI